MQKFILLFVSLFSFLNVIAQNCNLNDEAKRHMLKAEGMRETMQTSDDMQLVANEYEQAAQAAPYCPDIYYNLGLCYEELGKKQPQLFDKAIACYQKYLQLNPTAENKSGVEDLIVKIEGKKEMAQRQQLQINKEERQKQEEVENEQILTKLIGDWIYPNSSPGNIDKWTITLTDNGVIKAYHSMLQPSFNSTDVFYGEMRNKKLYLKPQKEYGGEAIIELVDITRAGFYYVYPSGTSNQIIFIRK